MSNCQEILREHIDFSNRLAHTEKHLIELKKEFRKNKNLGKEITIFAAGSLGRREVKEKTDFDAFIVSSSEKISNLDSIKVLATIVKVNNECNFKDFSNDGQFLNVHGIKNIREKMGTPDDDKFNLFTTRMLMLLEGTPVFGEKIYDEALKEIIDRYFKDYLGPPDKFLPIFLINDIIRFWRTLCMNYEMHRNKKVSEEEKLKLRKKNLNLKFARKLTIFATVSRLVTMKEYSPLETIEILKNEYPLKRIAQAFDNGKGSIKEFRELINIYNEFLVAKDEERYKDKRHWMELRDKSNRFSEIIFKFLMEQDTPLKHHLLL